MTARAMADLHALCFPDRPWPAPEITDLCARSDTLCVTGAGNQSFVIAQFIAPELEILTVCVHPAARARGLGRAVMEALFARCRDLGLSEIFLEVAADNAAALRLYRRLAFETAGTRKAYYKRKGAPAVDALIMRKAIT